MSLPVEGRSYATRREMTEDIVSLLGGRAAESLMLDDISTGASNDIKRATKLATNMIVKYGFSEKLGPVMYGGDDNEVFIGRDYGQTRSYSEKVAAEIDVEINEMIKSCFEKAKNILTEHEDKLIKVAEKLLETEKIEGDEFVELMKDEPETAELSEPAEAIENVEETAGEQAAESEND